VIATTTLTALAGCEGGLSVVDPAGPAARTIATLWWVLLAGAALIFALVMVLMVLPFVRRGGPDREEPGVRVWIIGLGLAFPLAVLAALLAYGLVVGERLLPRPGENVARVAAEGSRTAWTFTYGDAPGRRTKGVLHIPAGRPVDVEITTTDVIHSFWVPRLAGKLDAIPGHVNVLRIEADAPGTYQGLSAEFSGPGYADLTFSVTAHDAAGWVAFLEADTE
jgi:cytochrome c oxidase subunit 2/cytochrome aa3-600 menaquinol oxidase subunit 2